jgi:hypothetical protein
MDMPASIHTILITASITAVFSFIAMLIVTAIKAWFDMVHKCSSTMQEAKATIWATVTRCTRRASILLAAATLGAVLLFSGPVVTRTVLSIVVISLLVLLSGFVVELAAAMLQLLGVLEKLLASASPCPPVHGASLAARSTTSASA